ncbi:docking protein 2 isoform X2 [Carettochelys insculpta]|uniref:docking protein 2 isoform X2 n=1 Tax=Carettochelys insculpta TaxID=44489 RepID=UPI003EB6EA26
MDEGVVKQGLLYLQQQQTFGKKWRKFWVMLYRESACSCARLELFEGAGPPPSEKPKKAESSKKLIKLSNCVHVAEANADSPKETIPFILETTEKRYLLAADSSEAATWILTLCEVAFARSRDEQKAAAGKDGHLGSLAMEENSLYSSTAKAATREFRVTVRATEASERCRLWGSFILRAEDEALELQDLMTGDVLYTWPYKFLRRFGRDKVTFSFEAGRRCASGEGNFEFETTQGNEIFYVIESAINVQRGLGADELRWASPADDAFRVPVSGRTLSRAKDGEDKGSAAGSLLHHTASTKCLSLESSLEGKLVKGKLVKPTNSYPLSGEPTSSFVPPAGSEVTYAEPHDSLRLDPQGRAKTLDQVRKAVAQRKVAVESDYAVPFDTIAKSLLSSEFGSFLCGLKEPQTPYPLYDSIEEAGMRKRSQPPTHPKPEHIYDEPEGLSAPTHSVYDEPEEVKGEAWKLQATAEDPVGHEYPYNPNRDDYSVPKRPVPVQHPLGAQGEDWVGETEYDNVALKFLKKKNVQ